MVRVVIVRDGTRYGVTAASIKRALALVPGGEIIFPLGGPTGTEYHRPKDTQEKVEEEQKGAA